MAETRIYKTLRARFEAAEDYRIRGKTSEASDLNQLTIAEALIEILATLQEISESLKPNTDQHGEPKPVKLAATKVK